MSNNKYLPKIPEQVIPTTDLSDKDLALIDQFKAEGMPGLYEIKEGQVERMLDLYLSGKPYIQISRILMLPKSLIMYISQKYSWFSARQEYHFELESTIRNRLVEAKIKDQDFLLSLTQMYQKKIGRKISSYLATDDESHADAIDGKDVDKALKVMEMLHKIGSDAKEGKAAAPAVGLNLGDGVTVRKTGENSVEITPKQKTVSELLQQFKEAELAAEKEKNKI